MMLRTLLYRLSGLTLIVGALLPLFAPTAAAYTFAAGALVFAPIQLTDRYEGTNFTIRRLRRQQMIGALMLVVTACLMITAAHGIAPFRGHEWMITLLIATLLELYTAFRIDWVMRHEK